MHRKQILELLEKYIPLSPEEQKHKEQMMNFIERCPNCFERSLEEGHITASAWLLSFCKTKALLLHHAKLDIWCQPGGHADGNNNPLAVALQEAREESGIDEIEPLKRGIFDIDIHAIPAKGTAKEHLHYDVRFLLHVTSASASVCINKESKKFTWIEATRNLSLTKERSILRMVEKWIEYLKNQDHI